jgi:ATP-binding cassette subfamily F protein uup
MAPLVRFDAVSVAFGEQRILIEASFAIDSGERVCLIGRNGAGKSTTLRLITGAQEPDEGTVERPGQLRWSLLDQKLAEQSEQTVRDFVALGMEQQLRRIARFQELSAGSAPDRAMTRELERLQREIEAGGGWSIDVRVAR